MVWRLVGCFTSQKVSYSIPGGMDEKCVVSAALVTAQLAKDHTLVWEPTRRYK